MTLTLLIPTVKKSSAGAVSGENTGLSSEVRSKLKVLMSTDENAAIKYAAEYLGIDLSGATEVKANMGLRNYGQLSPSGVLSIGRDGFSSPEALLSTVGHEAVHLQQWLNKSFSAEVGDPRYHLNEIEAHKWELDNVHRTGFTSGVANNMNHIKGHMQHLIGTDHYWDVYRDMRGHHGFID